MAKPVPISDLIDTCLGPVLARQGFAARDIFSAWNDIVGARLARYSEPVKIDWKKQTPDYTGLNSVPEPANLVVRVEGAFALELQHIAPLIIERVNGHYGWCCVGRLILKQGPIRRDEKSQAAARIISEAGCQKVDRAIAGVEDAGLNEALKRLGHYIVS